MHTLARILKCRLSTKSTRAPAYLRARRHYSGVAKGRTEGPPVHPLASFRRVQLESENRASQTKKQSFRCETLLFHTPDATSHNCSCVNLVLMPALEATHCTRGYVLLLIRYTRVLFSVSFQRNIFVATVFRVSIATRIDQSIGI